MLRQTSLNNSLKARKSRVLWCRKWERDWCTTRAFEWQAWTIIVSPTRCCTAVDAFASYIFWSRSQFFSCDL